MIKPPNDAVDVVAVATPLPPSSGPRGGRPAASHPARSMPVLLAAVSQMLAATVFQLSAQDRPASVPVVQGPAEDNALSWRFEQRWLVGGYADTLLGGISPFTPANVDVDGPGNVYVLQARQARVVILSGRDATLVATVGRRGAGPGELQNARSLAVSGDSVLAVYDSMRGFVRWHLPTMSPQALDRAQAITVADNMMIASDGFVYAEMEFLPGGAEAEEMGMPHLTWRAGDETRRIMSGSVIGMPVVAFPTCGLEGLVTYRLFSPTMPWHDHGVRLAVASDREYSIHVFDELRPTMDIQRPIEARRVNRAMALREAEGRAVWRGCEVSADEAVGTLGFNEYLQAVARVAVAPDGGLWALRGMVNDERHLIDVFANDGEYMGTLPPDSPFPIAFVSSDRILVGSADDVGVPTLAAYDVNR